MVVLVVAAALAVSGCSGGGSASPSPTTHTGVPGTDTQVPTASPTPVPLPTPGVVTLTTADQLFDLDSLHSYQYRLTSTQNGWTYTGLITIMLTDESYHGVAARHMVMSMDASTVGAGSGQMVIDFYTSKADNSTLGGHVTMSSNGKTVLDQPIQAGGTSTYTSTDPVVSGEASSDARLTKAGTDTIVVNGISYACTVYTYADQGKDYTIWYSPQVPMPVKEMWLDGLGNSCVIELMSWG